MEVIGRIILVAHGVIFSGASFFTETTGYLRFDDAGPEPHTQVTYELQQGTTTNEKTFEWRGDAIVETRR